MSRGTSMLGVLPIFDEHSSAGRHGTQLPHAELGGDGPRALVGVIDARDDPLELRGVECPREQALACSLSEALLLSLRPEGTQQLEVLSAKTRRPDEPPDAQGVPAFDNREHVV